MDEKDYADLKISGYNHPESALLETGESYRRIVDLSPYGIGILSDGKVAYVNQTGAKILGAQNPFEIIGNPIFDYMSAEYHAFDMERIAKVEAGHVVPLAEEQLTRLDKSKVDVEIGGVPFIYHGQPAIYVVFQDITGRKKTEEALSMKIKEITKMNELMVDRELKMVELKKENKELKNRLEEK